VIPFYLLYVIFQLHSKAFPESQSSEDVVVTPMDRLCGRMTKKPFGIYISPSTSPVKPERFSGYHTGTDFEIFDDEKDQDVRVDALWDGKVIEKRTATGYGGVVVLSCVLQEQPVTVVYGHLRIGSVLAKVGDRMKEGNKIGFLGNAFSAETDGERKHLHLSIHIGTDVNIRGYVQSKNELKDWIDPGSMICTE